MTSLNKDIFVCVDCETTGLDIENDRVIEVGIIRFQIENELERYETLVDPEQKISKESMDIHNITDAMVEGKPKIAEVMPQILEHLKDGIIVGHGVSFDLDILTKEAHRAGIKCDFSKRRIADTLRLARLYGQSHTNSLEGLRRHFNIPAQSAHRALDDAHVNVEVFKHLVTSFRTTDQLFKALDKPIAMRTIPLGRHKGRLFSEVPLDYLKWAANKDFDRDLLFSIRSEINRRKKGDSFRQSGNPFQNL